MKRKYILFPLTFVLLLTTLSSCKKYLDINRDPNLPADVTEKLMLPAIIGTFSYEVAGGYPTRTATLWTKHLAYAGADRHSGSYYLTENDVDNFWRFSSYNSVMGTAVEMIAKAEKNGNPSYAAIGRIILAWNLSYLTECYGSIPYSDAFKAEQGVIKPKYDTQEDIYKEIQKLLDQSIVDAGKGTGLKPGVDDFIYGGVMQSWVHLANTLKARFYLRLSNAPGYNAATQADLALKALDAGAITDKDAPTATYFSVANAENPWYQFAIGGKWNFSTKPSQYYVNLLLGDDEIPGTLDPRLPFQVSVVPKGSDPANPGVNAGKYVGVTNDGPPLNIANYSPIGSFYSARNAKLNLLVYAEVPFIRAEAEFLKANKSVNAAVVAAYNEGVAASMTFYGIDVNPSTSSAETKAYLAYPDHVINLATSSTDAYRRIMQQKYIANYLQFEAYNDFRRTGYPVLPINDEVYAPDVDLVNKPEMGIIPLRLPYPSSERSYNKENIPSDIPINTVNAMQIPVWWDKK